MYMADDDETPGLIPQLQALLGPVNAQFKKDLEGYKISELYGCGTELTRNCFWS